MKISLTPKCSSISARRGLMLTECLIYMSVLLLVLGLAFSAFYHFQFASAQLRRSSDDIARVLQAGERWRDDVRSARTAELLSDERGAVLHLRGAQGGVRYSFFSNEVRRSTTSDGPWIPFLRNVRASEMILLNGEYTSSCKWEVELLASNKTVRLPPLFTFISVVNPGNP